MDGFQVELIAAEVMEVEGPLKKRKCSLTPEEIANQTQELLNGRQNGRHWRVEILFQMSGAHGWMRV